MTVVRRLLDALYTLAAVLAALCLIIILALIVIQMLARWTGEVFPGAPDYAGYAMAAASFLAFASALNKGSHIRVSILLNVVGERMRFFLEVWCFSIATAAAWYVSWYIWRMVGFAIKFNDVSQGQDATPMWMVYTPVLVGAIILAIALTDNLITLLVTGKHRIVRDVTDAHAE
ncbi:TRAP transporter small permease [Sulfitobacter aestuariivivens]|uniref:TRAP transporter small permease protein n=1 Tax=Sulfitobacter aestuariivivens TaxID=2766981 RepID=A0A927HFV1_9RHOB|nr:TRAP transporter small permease subunit [Sulfitobacter aestuariivivens]MBD3666232.1 TRAP transporter small permease subunit [Sulfitobacter aestuariivivens]